MRKDRCIVEVFQQLRRMVHALDTFSREVEGRFGLTAPQLWALWELGQGPLALKDLAARLQVHPSTLVGVIDRLAARGLVSRTQDPVDRRRVSIALTQAGAALRDGAPHPAQGRLLHGLRAMKAGEVAELHQALGRLVAAMEAEDLEARFFFEKP